MQIMNIITLAMVSIVVIMVLYPTMEGVFMPKAIEKCNGLQNSSGCYYVATPGKHNGTKLF